MIVLVAIGNSVLRTNAGTYTFKKKLISDECSRHEQFSDTIYWTITLIFRREEGESSDKQIIDYNYEVKRIPESIAVATLLRQFIKPRKVHLNSFVDYHSSDDLRFRNQLSAIIFSKSETS